MNTVNLDRKLRDATREHQQHERELMARTPALINRFGWLPRLLVRMLRVLRI